VRLASAIDAAWLLDLFSHRLVEKRELRFDSTAQAVEEVSTLAYGNLILDESRRRDVQGEEVERLLARAALDAGPAAFGAEDAADAVEHLRARLAFAATLEAGFAPIDDRAVEAAMVTLCKNRRSFAQLRAAGGLSAALRDGLSPGARQRLERLAPDHVVLPGGRRLRVSYEENKPPWVASRLQDFFGSSDGPCVGDGRVPVVLHLLAPSQRPVQVTSDLGGFWRNHYPAIRRELMRRYPKHAWPEDPLGAAPPRKR
jgi:ATP-dependent helicase HrpB